MLISIKIKPDYFIEQGPETVNDARNKDNCVIIAACKSSSLNIE